MRNQNIQNRGVSLLEVVLYIGLFSIVTLMVNTGVMSLQRVAMNHGAEYKRYQLNRIIRIIVEYNLDTYGNSIEITGSNFGALNVPAYIVASSTNMLVVTDRDGIKHTITENTFIRFVPILGLVNNLSFIYNQDQKMINLDYTLYIGKREYREQQKIYLI